ncbi:hypothetical protein [Cuniculiplasma divulgatum]|nr:hypothetical protein [Cuniculiplasma divulgatum]
MEWNSENGVERTVKMAENTGRDKNFHEKFESASKELNGNGIYDVESLKFRSMSYYGYTDLLKQLKLLKVEKAKGNYQGMAWKITEENGHSILIVEHETGLEILYVVGAIASVTDLIWKVASLWNRGRLRHFPEFERFEMERRRFGKNDLLIEESISSFETVMFQHLLNMYERLNERVSLLESKTYYNL